MSKHDQLLAMYSGILESLDMVIQDDGIIMFQPPGAVGKDNLPLMIPANVAKKHWVMPTKKVLAESPWEDHIAFHPLSENILNSYSATINQLKVVVNFKLNMVLGALLARLTEFAADTEHHGTVSAKSGKYLKLVPNLKTISAKRMMDIVTRTEMDSNRRLINIFLKKTPEIEGHRYLKGAMVNFPFRDELNGAEPKVFGVTISKSDQESFKALFDYILPENELLETYSVGSDSRTAPAFESLMQVYNKVGSRLNDVIQTHRKIMDSHKDLMIDLTWAEELEMIDSLASIIPPLPGNVGEPPRGNANVEMTEASKSVVKKRAASLFDDKVTSSPVKGHVPVVSNRAGDVHQEERGPIAEVDNTRLTFRERIEMQKTNLPRSLRRDYGGDTRRGYSNTREEPVPAWMDNPSGSRVVAGDDPSQRPVESSGRFNSRLGEPTGSSSFRERMDNRNKREDERDSRSGSRFRSGGGSGGRF